MKDEYAQAEQFLNQVFDYAGFDLRASASANEGACILNIEGKDSPALRSEGGELLDALEHFVNQSFTRGLPQGERFVCDVDDFRSMRETELRAMARLAAEKVKITGLPFTFGPMNANERRVIHLALAEDEQLRTESVGEGNARRLRVSAKR